MNRKILMVAVIAVCIVAVVIIAMVAGCNSCNDEKETTAVQTTEAVMTSEEVEETSEEVIETTQEETTEAVIETTEEVIETTEEETEEVTERATEAEVITEAPTEATKSDSSGVSDAGLLYDIASLATAAQTNQIVMAVGDGSLTGAMLYLFEKGEDSIWRMTLETPAFWGRNGISYHTIEGDQTTPAGSFDLGLAFGNLPNPGTALEWVDVNPYMYWIDDVNSDYYNLLIDSREVPDGWASGEHLSKIVPDYNYSIDIEVNPTRRKDSTSAIFLHCGSGPTAGCVAIPENCMVTILQRLKPGAKMIIAENASTVSLY